MTTDRIKIRALDPSGAADGQSPRYDAASGKVIWSTAATDSEAVRDLMAATLAPGSNNVTLLVDDAGNTITVKIAGTYRGDWSGSSSTLATYDFAAQAVDALPPAPFTTTQGGGWVKVKAYYAPVTGITPTPPAHHIELRDNGTKLTFPVGTAHPTADKVRFWMANNSETSGSAPKGTRCYVNGVQQGTALLMQSGYEQREVTVVPGTDTVEWRHDRNYNNYAIAGYVALIEVIDSNGGQVYEEHDLVTYNGSLWGCVTPGVEEVPGTGSAWVEIANVGSGGGGGATTFSALTDVDWSTPPTDGQVFSWDAASSKLVPTDLPAGGGPLNFDDLADVDMTGIVDGQIPVWDAATSTWLPGTPSAGGGGGSGDVYWYPASGNADLEPASPSSYDDEGDGTTSAPWVATPTAPAANDLVSDQIHIKAVSASAALVGKIQPAPTTYPFTVIAKLNSHTATTGSRRTGIILGPTAPTNTSSAKIIAWVNNSGAFQLVGQKFGGTWESNGATKTIGQSQPAYIKVVVTSATGFSWYVSADGDTWTAVDSGTISGWTIGTIGLFANDEGASGGTDSYFEFFRVAQGSDPWHGEATPVSLDLNGLTDVDTVTTPPADGEVLSYDSASSQWIPAAAPSGGGSSGYTIRETLTTAGGDNVISLGGTPLDEGAIYVWVGGVLKIPTVDYSIEVAAGVTTLTFPSPFPTGSQVHLSYTSSVAAPPASTTSGDGSYASLIIADGAWGHWRETETSGNLADATGHGRTLNVTGTPTYNTTGPKNKAIDWPANTGVYARSSAGVSFDAADKGQTFEIWAYLAANPSGQLTLMQIGDNATGAGFNNAALYITSAGKVGGYAYVGSTFTMESASALALNQWNHIVFAAKAGTQTIRVNKALVASGAANWLGYTNTLWVHGGWNATAQAVRTAEPAFYAKFLPAASSDAHYDAP